MKFLLVGINAKYIHSNPAVYSLKAYAGEGYEKEIEIAEYTLIIVWKRCFPVFMNGVRMWRPFLVIYGIGILCRN